MSSYDSFPIPSGETATDPIDSPADLRQRWRALLGPLGFGERLVRFAFVGPDRRLLKVLSEIPIAKTPMPAQVENLMAALRAVLTGMGEGFTVALLLTRPGVGDVTDTDRRWAALLVEQAHRFDVAVEPIFVANDDRISLVEPAVGAVRSTRTVGARTDRARTR